MGGAKPVAGDVCGDWTIENDVKRDLAVSWPPSGRGVIASERHSLGEGSTNTGKWADMRRAVTVPLAILGAAGAAILVFLQLPSLLMTGGADSDAPTLEIRDLALGTYQSFDGRHSRLYVVRTPADEVWALTVPLQAGRVELPHIHWSAHPAFSCANFGPETSEGALTPTSVFRCRDADVPAWWVPRWRWALNGRSASQIPDYIDDMPRVKVERSGAVVHVYRWDIQW